MPKEQSVEAKRSKKTTENKLSNKNEKKSFKPVKRLKRNDLIAEQEKTKMWHKYKKMMRKEDKKSNDDGKKTWTSGSIKNGEDKNELYKDGTHRENKARFGKERFGKATTANQRAQTEYENNLKLKQKEQEVC